MWRIGNDAKYVCSCCRKQLSREIKFRGLAAYPVFSRFITVPSIPSNADVHAQRTSSARKKKSNRKRHVFYPLGKLRGTPGKTVREKFVNLETQSLGQPSEVIILRDTTFNPGTKENEKMQREVTENPTLDSKAIVASIEAEKLQLDVADVIKEVDRLRPGPFLSQEKFLDIRNHLRNGFTAQQLRKYIKAKYPDFSRENKLKKSSFEAQSPSKSATYERGIRSLWLPGTRSIEDRLPLNDVEKSRLRAYKSSYKVLLAEIIVLGCWNVTIEEDIDAAGQIEMRIRPWQCSLLLAGGICFPDKFL